VWILVSVAGLNALCYPLITLGLRDAPPLAFAALRALTAGLALTVPASLKRRALPRAARTWMMLAAIGLGTTTLGLLGMFVAGGLVAPGLATVMGNTQPLLAAFLARCFLQERLHPRQRLGLLLGFAGIVIISLPHLRGPGGARFERGLAYIALAVAGVAVGNVLMKAVRGRVDPLVAMAAQSLFGALPLAIATGVWEQPSAIIWSGRFVASLLGLGLFASALGNWLWFSVLERVPLSRANAFNFLTPLIGFTLGVAFYGERLDPASIVGLSLTVTGIVLVERARPAATP
jgi:drug/metabolite transporter (DMT)-like permease